MDYRLSSKEQTLFVRVCMVFASRGVLNLNPTQIIQLYQEILVKAEHFNDKDTVLKTCYYIGLLLSNQGRLEEAVDYQRQGLRLAEDLGNKRYQMYSYGNLGNAYLYMKKGNEALRCYEAQLKVAQDIKDKGEEAATYYNMGSLYSNVLGQHDKAIEQLTKLLKIAKQTKDLSFQKIAYANMSNAYMEMGKTHDAINCCFGFLEITQVDNRETMFIYDRLGSAFMSLNDPSQASVYLMKSLEITQKLQDYSMEMKCFERLGIALFNLGKLPEALNCFERQLKLSKDLGDIGSEGNAYVSQGGVYAKMGNHDKAIKDCQKALDIAMEMENKEHIAIVYGNLGNIYQGQGDYRNAIKYHNLQLDVCTDISLPEGQSRAYDSLGVNYKCLGQYYESIQYHEMALEICVTTGDKRDEATTEANLGTIHILLGQYENANKHLNKSLEMARAMKDRYLEGKVLGNLGTAAFRTNNIKLAADLYKKSLEIASEIGDRDSESSIYVNIGICKEALGLNDEALKLFDQQIQLATDMHAFFAVCSGYTSKATIHSKVGNYQEAISCFESALKISQDSHDKATQATNYLGIGVVYSFIALNHKERDKVDLYVEAITKSINHLKEALECWEWVFDHIKEQDHFKISFLDTYIMAYKYLTSVVWETSDFPGALMESERGKARALEDLLASKYGRVRFVQQVSKSQLSFDDVKKMSKVPILYYDMNVSVLFSWLINAGSVTVHSHSYNKDSALSDIVKDLYCEVKVRDMKCEDRLIMTEPEHRTTDHSEVFPLLTSNDDLLLAAVKSICIQRNIPKECFYDEECPNPLEELYNQIFLTSLNQVHNDEIIIVPDGDLFKVPFAALRDPKTGLYLSDMKRIRLVPSLTILKLLMESPADFHCKTGALIIGNPYVGEVMFQAKKITPIDLPSAQEEATKIGKLLGVRPFLHVNATKSTIMDVLRDGVAIIHIAAHGTRDGEIFLSPPSTVDIPKEQDYLLTMNDVQQSGVRPQLVVLSCCHSGRGDIKADGVIGMSRAFLAAGARAVVASLWAIADEATMVFMEHFYNHLRNGKSASASLQKAMKEMRDSMMYRDPMFWAPFFLLGDDVTFEL